LNYFKHVESKPIWIDSFSIFKFNSVWLFRICG